MKQLPNTPHVIFLLALVFVCNELRSQSYLNVGDRLPAELLKYKMESLKGPTSIAEISKGKLLIIDFWATWCSSCIGTLTKLDSLKETFKGELDYMAVSYESKEKVEAFIRRREDLQRLDNPFIVKDTILSKYFLYRSVPHIVWVSQDGIVVSITTNYAVSENNIRKYLQDNLAPTKFIKKDKEKFNYDKGLPPDSIETVASSILARGIPGTTSRGHAIEDYNGFSSLSSWLKGKNTLKRHTIYNNTISNLYKVAAFSGMVSLANTSRTIVEVADPDLVMLTKESIVRLGDQYDEWVSKNYLCYQLSFNEFRESKEFYRYMLADLNRYLPYTGEIQKRMRPCYVIKFNGDKSKLIKSNPATNITSERNFITGFEGFTIGEIVNYLNFEDGGISFLDETGLEELFNLPLRFAKPRSNERLDIKGLSDSFEKLGFTISLQERLIDVLVLKDK